MTPTPGGRTSHQHGLVPSRMSGVAEIVTADRTRLAVFADVGEGDGLVLHTDGLADLQAWAEFRHTWGLDVTVIWGQIAVDSREPEWLDEEASGIEQALSDWRERGYSRLLSTEQEAR